MFKNFLSLKDFLVGIVVFILVAIAVAAPRWVRLYHDNALRASSSVDIFLEKETAPVELSKLLVEKGVLKNPNEFEWAIQLLRWNKFRMGHYRLETNVSYHEMLSKMGRGLQDPIKLTVLPGQLKSRLIQSMAQSFHFNSLALKKALTDSIFLEKEDIDSREVIGHLYPATYDFYWTTKPQKVIKRLFGTFEDNIGSNYNKRLQELGKSLNEIITLASIIEWESKMDKEKPVISGLYWNRLKKGMRLQADPTVNYAVGERRRLTYNDYKVEHPYNTYLHAGLPPGPITNPSKSSIEAALYPADHNYFYMVASPEGTHNFSETYKEHRQKSAEWRRWLQKQYRIKREQENNDD